MKRKKSMVSKSLTDISSSSTSDVQIESNIPQQQQQQQHWKRIDLSELILPSDEVATATTTTATFSNNKTIISDQNHYDDDDDNDHDDDHDTDVTIKKQYKSSNTRSFKTNKKSIAEYELTGQPHEPFGIFYSLEVMDGTIASSLINHPRNKNQNQQQQQQQSSKQSKEQEPKEQVQKEHRMKPPKDLINKSTSNGETHSDVQSFTTEAASTTKTSTINNTNKTSSSKKKKKKHHDDDNDDDDNDMDHHDTIKPNECNTTDSEYTKTENNNDDTNVADVTTTKSNSKHDEQATDSTSNTITKEIENIRNVWFKECSYAIQLHNCICHTLYQQKYYIPTMIQSLTIPSTIVGQQNLVGAAPTGSGKTLAFLIPIFHTLFTLIDTIHDTNNNHNNNQQQQQHKVSLPLPLQALIVTPTRELALQIYNVGMKFCIPHTPTNRKNQTTENNNININNLYYSSISIACITGGLATAKQIRILQSKYRPPTIIVGTPGRLWELISSQLYTHLNQLSQLRFVVIDEADQMVDMSTSTTMYNPKNRYKFPELIKILDTIHQANPMTEDNDDENDNNGINDEDDDMDMDRMLGLPGIPGEARVAMLNDKILVQMEQYQSTSTNVNDNVGLDDNDNANEDDENDDDDILVTDNDIPIDDDDLEFMQDEANGILPVLPPVRRQTFVFSATLTLPNTSNTTSSLDTNNRRSKNNKKKRQYEDNTNRNALSKIHGAIADLLEKAHAVGRTKIVDLTNGSIDKNLPSNSTDTSSSIKSNKTDPKVIPTTNQFQFPPGLQFHHIQCTQRHKDSHLYAYLLYFMSTLQQPSNTTTEQQKQQSSILIFCNSIAAVRRVGMTLTTLRLPVRILHAHMQQRARFKAIESLQNDDIDNVTNHFPTIVVATDVAARGLDIPSVATVIHYDAARTVDTFIHRSGRTARGIGVNAVGSSLSLVASGEDQFHNKIVKSLNVEFKSVPIDGRLLRLAQERVNLACKVATAEDTDRKKQRDDQWFIDQAKQAGLEVDDDLLNNVQGDEDDLVRKKRTTTDAARVRAIRKEAEIARKRLHELLNQPVQTQRYGKFLSTLMIQQQTNVRPTGTTLLAVPSPSLPSALADNGRAKKRKKHR